MGVRYSDDLKRSLKGKRCFHIKKLDVSLYAEIKEMVEKGFEIYKKHGWI